MVTWPGAVWCNGERFHKGDRISGPDAEKLISKGMAKRGE